MDRTPKDPVTFASAADAKAALQSIDLTPPPAPDSLQPGPTADLRAAMARFSKPDVHPDRRASVLAAIDSIDGVLLAAAATTRSKTALDRGLGHGQSSTDDETVFDLMADLAFVVPVETLGVAMGTPESELATLRADVRLIVEVIGRQQPSTQAADAATRRLINRFDRGPLDTVAVISLLYQTHDATAALFAATVLAEQEGTGRRPALARTIRVATRAITIGATDVTQGATVIIDLEQSGHEFGSGPHECPGRQLAEVIVSGMMAAVRSSAFQLDHEQIDRHEDGRALTLPVRHRP